MDNKAHHYAGQPCMIYIWESLWRGIANRLEDEKDNAYEYGLVWTKEDERKLKAADYQWDTLAAMLEEAEQLQQNVSHVESPIKWKFNMIKRW